MEFFKDSKVKASPTATHSTMRSGTFFILWTGMVSSQISWRWPNWMARRDSNTEEKSPNEDRVGGRAEADSRNSPEGLGSDHEAGVAAESGDPLKSNQINQKTKPEAEGASLKEKEFNQNANNNLSPGGGWDDAPPPPPSFSGNNGRVVGEKSGNQMTKQNAGDRNSNAEVEKSDNQTKKENAGDRHADAEVEKKGGKATYYTEWNQSPGSCGYIPSFENLVALAPQFMKQSCGKCVLIKYGGKTEKATVTDTCEACRENERWIDMSDALFKKFDILSKGVLKAIDWEFTDC